jgi:hypothetical protein
MEYFEKKHDYHEAHVKAYELLIKLDDDLWDMPSLDDGEITEQVGKIHEELNRLAKKLEAKVREEDKLNFQKWVNSNK